MKEFRFFAFKGVADDLQYPSEDEHACGVHPERMQKDTGHQQRE